MRRGRKYRLLLRIYAITGVLTLGLYAAVSTAYLARWRQTAAYGAALSFVLLVIVLVVMLIATFLTNRTQKAPKGGKA